LFATTEALVMAPSLAHVPGPAAGVTPRANHCGITQRRVQRPLLMTGPGEPTVNAVETKQRSEMAANGGAGGDRALSC